MDNQDAISESTPTAPVTATVAAPVAAPDRRRFLSFAWFGALALFALGLVGGLFNFLTPTTRQGEFGGSFNLGSISQLPAAGDAPLNHPKGRFWLVRSDNGLVALYKACTHLDCLFNWNPQEKLFICPCHGSKFSPRGKVLNGPAPRDLDRFVVRLISPKGGVLAESGAESGGRLSLVSLQSAPASQKDSQMPQAIWQLGRGKDAVRIPSDTQVWVDTGQKLQGRRAEIA